MDLLQEQFLNHQLKTALALNESFGDVNVGKVGEEHIYTNDKVKQSFIESIRSQDTFKPIIDTIVRLVETDRIIPAFVRVGLIQRIIRHYRKEKERFAESAHTLAHFDIDTRKIIVLVENINDTGYWKKQEALSLVLLHELQHMTSILFPVSFLSIHKKAMIAYYKQFIKLFFNVQVTDVDAFKLITWMHSKTETIKGMENSAEFGKDYLHILWDLLSHHQTNDKDLHEKVVAYFKAIQIYLSHPNMYIELTVRKDPSTYLLYRDLIKAYKSLNIMKTDTLAVQETLYSSEVICIESEYNTQPRHFKLIEKIE